MIQRTFPVITARPRVVITNVDGHLDIRAWEKQEIHVETQGKVGMLNQEDDTLIVTDCQGDLILWIPAIAETELIFSITTDVIAIGLGRGVNIANAGDVVLEEVAGDAQLCDIHGNVELANVCGRAELANIGGSLHARHIQHLNTQYIGGNATLIHVTEGDLGAVGGNFIVNSVGNITCGAVGRDVEADVVEDRLQCNTIGGNCAIRNSTGIKVNIHAIGGDFICDGALLTAYCMIGGNLCLQSDFPPDSQLRCHISGNADITLPLHANLALRTTVGGNVSSPISTYVCGGGFVTLQYGGGSAQFDLTVDGDLTLFGEEPRSSTCQFSWDEFGQRLANFGYEIERVYDHNDSRPIA